MNKRILWVRDLLATQQRYTIKLACHHVVSLDALTVGMMTTRERAHLANAVDYPCPFCPEEIDSPIEKTPTQLWKEAGEP